MASRFWVLGTGTWDASDTTHWATTSGAGSGGASVPGAGDDVTINASSGAGTITVNTNFAINTLTTSAMGMTLDFGTNNNSPTITTGSGVAWTNSGTGTRTINLGSGTFTFGGTTNNTGIDWGTTTNLTLGANTATFLFTGTTTSGRSIDFGNTNLSNLPSVSIGANSSRGVYSLFGSGTMTIPTLTLTAPTTFVWGTTSISLTNLVLSGGSVSSPIFITSNGVGTQRTIPLANSTSGAGLMIHAINPTTGTITGTNSIDLGRNGANVSLTAPSGGGGVVGVIGG